MRILPRNLLLGCVLAAISQPALAALGPWASTDKVRARLVATAPAADGTVDGAIEIELAPGWKTYWRSPGDAGVPPNFDFSASLNARAAAVEFPAPVRHDDGYAASNVYHDKVLLPVRFTIIDPGKPVKLDVQMAIGLCDEICIPVNLQTSLDVPEPDGDPVAPDLLAKARAILPGPGTPGEFELLDLRRVGGPDDKPEFEATYVGSGDGKEDLFVETPEDWFPSPPKAVTDGGGELGFRFVADRRVASGAIAGTAIRLTLTGESGATSRIFTLDAQDASP